MSNRNALELWLHEDFKKEFNDRMNRLAFLVDEFGDSDGISLFHGVLCKEAFEEARTCYLNGDYLGCILLCQCYVENTLRSILFAMGSSDESSDKELENAGMNETIAFALNQGLISISEAKELGKIKDLRNKYVHHVLAMSKRNNQVINEEHFTVRCVRENSTPWTVLEKDAKLAIRYILDFSQKPFLRINSY